MDRRDAWFFGGLAALVGAGVWWLKRKKPTAPRRIEQALPDKIEHAKSWVINDPGQKPAVVVPHVVETLAEG